MNIFRRVPTFTNKRTRRPWFAHALANLAALYLMYGLARGFMKAAEAGARRKIRKRNAKLKIGFFNVNLLC